MTSTFDRQAVDAVCADLTRRDTDAKPEIWGNTGKRVEPLCLWLPSIGAWVREDGSYISFDSRAEWAFVYPNWMARWRIRQAVATYRRNGHGR